MAERGSVVKRKNLPSVIGGYATWKAAQKNQKVPGTFYCVTELDVAESILNAVAIYKRSRSGSPRRGRVREYLYIIQSTNLAGLPIYTKGKLIKETNQESYYFLVSSKRAL